MEKDEHRRQLHRKLTASWFRSKIPWLLYPLAMALLIGTTFFTCAIVLFNLLVTLFNFKYTRAEPFVLGIASISKMGVVGSLIQTLLIMYIWCASLVGLYALPVLGLLRPIAGKTPFFKIMLNCMVVLILSSALPLFTRTVGITNFDLFGSFGQIVWLQNYHLVLVYNCAFLVALSICLCHSIVVKLSREFLARLHNFYLLVTRFVHAVVDKFHQIRDTLANTFDATRPQASSSPMEPNNSSVARPFCVRSMFRNTLHTLLASLYSVLHLRTVHATGETAIKNAKKLS